VTLLAAASTPIAMLVYAAGLTQTSQHTLDAKAKLLVGSNVSVGSTDPLRRTVETDRVGTVVTRYLYGKIGGEYGGTFGGTDVAVLAIDPDTFGRTAYWDDRFADRPLADLLDRLRRPTADGRTPAIVAGGRLDPRFDVALGTTTARIEVVGTARLFPGRRLPVPMVIVSASRLGQVDQHAGWLSELWTTGPADAARAALDRQHARVFDVRQQDSVFQAANFLGISWTFGYLSALAALVGLVAVGGLLLYLETRQRSRVASYALGRRMGLTRATHLRSLLAELGTLLLTAFTIGTTLAWIAVLMIYHRLDVDPARPPAPLLTAPTTAIAGAAAAVVLVAGLATLYAQRAADRTDVATVLRLGG
jgi:putative ABC transport system permease protein